MEMRWQQPAGVATLIPREGLGTAARAA